MTAQQKASQKALKLKGQPQGGGERVTLTWQGIKAIEDPVPGRPMLIRRRALLQLLGISNTTLYDWVAAGTFPPPIKIGQNSVAWMVDEVSAFIEAHRQKRDQQLALALEDPE